MTKTAMAVRISELERLLTVLVEDRNALLMSKPTGPYSSMRIARDTRLVQKRIDYVKRELAALQHLEEA